MSRAGVNSHFSHTCSTESAAVAGEFMLFGVRVTVDSMRKSVSLNNLSQYEQPHQESSAGGAGAGYASADDATPHSAASNRERKRGVPWTEDEHKLFLIGLQKVGKGDWRGISRNFVKTRTPTQVASHAQKYFLRRNNLNRRRRRSSLFDITTDAISPMEEEQIHPENAGFPSPKNRKAGGVPAAEAAAPFPVVFENDASSSSSSMVKLVRPIPIPIPAPAPVRSMVMVDFDLNLKSTADPLPLSLKLSLPSSDEKHAANHSALHALASFRNGDSVISVA